MHRLRAGVVRPQASAAAGVASGKCAAMERVHLVDHPAAAERIAGLRDATTPPAAFRRLLEELGGFLAYEATRDLATVEERLETPVESGRRYGPGS